MKMKQPFIFAVVSAIVFLLIINFIPKIMAQEGIIGHTKAISERNVSQDISKIQLTRSKWDYPQLQSVSQSKYLKHSFSLPYLISIPKPVSFPRIAIQRGWEGQVVMALEILESGLVGRAYVAQSSGYDVLDNAAIQDVRFWKFSPALKDDKPVVEYVQVPVNFKLEDI